jgi:hypothetical protein
VGERVWLWLWLEESFWDDGLYACKVMELGRFERDFKGMLWLGVQQLILLRRC